MSGWDKVFLAIAAAAALFLVSGCMALPSAMSAAGGWYTHDRIDKLEMGRVEALEKRVGELEEKE